MPSNPSSATRLADFGSGIGTAGATLTINTATASVGIGTTLPAGTLQVGTGITMYGSSGIVSATKFYGDGTNLTNTGSTLSASSGTQRVVLTGQTSGTMTASSTNSNLSFNSTTNTLSATAFSGNGIIPVGGIIMWSGSIAGIPTGWALCDGSNGTPNLRDRFVVGAGNNYSVAGVGGTTDAIVVSHNHTGTASVTDPGHFHTYQRNNGAWNTGTSGNTAVAANQGESSPNTSTVTTGIGVTITINTNGSSGTNANLPPYYALAFIMRTI